MSIDRRKFILGAGLGIAAAASPISLFGKNEAPAQIKRSGRLKLKFFPYELKLKHAFNLAKYSRTTTPDVQVELEYDGVVGYGECSRLRLPRNLHTLSTLSPRYGGIEHSP